MSETLTQTADQQTTQTTDNNQQQNALADALWNGTPIQQPENKVEPTPDQQQQSQAADQSTTTQANISDEEVMDINEWIKSQTGLENVDAFKAKWNEVSKPATPQPQEVKWSYDESKEEEIYNYINQKKQLDRFEKMDIADANQASEIIKANLQFKHKDLTPQQIDRLYQRQYALPEKPVQNLESDEEYAQVIANWQRQVQDKEQDIMIDAKIAKPELLNYKSQLVKPDIPTFNNPNVQQQGPSQEDLAAQEAFRNGFVEKLKSDYRNFKGYNTMAKDGVVELPINYSIPEDESLAFVPVVQKAVDNINDFLDNELGWWDKNTNSFNTTKMQEDLYLLLNRDKVFSKFAGEASAKRYEHHLKTSNNINLKGVNNQMDIPTGQPLDEKAKFKQLADTMWGV